MKNSEIFYFDVDGTLLDNATHTVPPSTLESLRQLKQKGYKVALCTGRNYEGIIDANVLDLIEWDGYVLANGSLVMDAQRNILAESIFDPELLKRIDAAVSGPLLLEGEEIFLTKKANQRFLEAKAHFGIEADYPTKPHTDEKVYNLICYNFDDIDQTLLNDLNTHCLMMFDQLGNTEIIPGNSGKNSGTAILNKHLNITRFTGFGDGENDVDFLTEATHSVAMGNGVDNVKRVSTFTTLDVNQDGIQHALKHFEVL